MILEIILSQQMTHTFTEHNKMKAPAQLSRRHLMLQQLFAINSYLGFH